MAPSLSDEKQPEVFAACLPALDATTPLMLRRIDEYLENQTASIGRDSVRIAVAEVLNNIVEHAYQKTKLGAVAVYLRPVDHGLSISIRDWGQPYACKSLPLGEPPNPQVLAEGGYGWFLIRELMSKVTYERDRRSNRLTLFLNF